MRGADCGFNEGLFCTFTAVFWILTALPLLAWSMPCLRRGWNASAPARTSLLLAALSAVCCCLDDVFKGTVASYGNQTLWCVGSVFLVFSVCVFAHQWCNVASALLDLHGRGGDAEAEGKLLISRVRLTYKWMSLMHIPFAALYSAHDYENIRGANGGDTIMQVWGVWLLVGTIGGLSGLAIAQLYIARVCLAKVESARSLHDTALINLVEQLFFDLLVVVYIALWMSDNRTEGSNIAAYHSVGFVTFWAMHAQVVFFFAILGNTDPLYSQECLSKLLLSADGATDNSVPASTVGSPQAKAPGQDMA